MASRNGPITDPGLIAQLDAQAVDVSDPFVQAIIYGENSGWDQVSPKGARTPLQVMPATAAKPGFNIAPAKDVNDPIENIRVGRDYAKAMLQRYGGNPELAAIAYNAGPDVADNYLKGGKLPAETQAYLPRVLQKFNELTAGNSAGGTAGGPITDQALIDQLDNQLADQEGGFGHEFKKSFMGTLGPGNERNAAKTIEALGGALGDKSVEEWGRTAALGLEQPNPRIGTYTDVPGSTFGETAANLRDYIAQLAGQTAGSTAAFLGGKAAGKGIEMTGLKRVGRVVGSLGTASASYLLNTGDVYQSLEQELQGKLTSGEVSRADVQQVAVLAGIPVAAMDYASFGALTAPFKQRMVSGVAKAFLQGAGIEGATEVVQQVMEEAAGAYLGGDRSMLQRFNNVVDAGFGGVIGGGVTEGGAHVAGALTGGHAPAETPPPPPAQEGGQPVPTPGIDPNTGIATVAPPTFDEEGNVVQESAPGAGPGAPQGAPAGSAAPGPAPVGPAPTLGAPAGGGLPQAGPMASAGVPTPVPGPAGPAAPTAPAAGPLPQTAPIITPPPALTTVPVEPAAPAGAVTTPPEATAPAGPSVIDLRGMGQAIGENLRAKLYATYQAGETKENGQESVYLQVPKAIKARGRDLTPDEFSQVLDQVAAVKGVPRVRQRALSQIVADWSPSAAPANGPVVSPELAKQLDAIVTPTPQAPVSEPAPAATVMPPAEIAPSGPQKKTTELENVLAQANRKMPETLGGDEVADPVAEELLKYSGREVAVLGRRLQAKGYRNLKYLGGGMEAVAFQADGEKGQVAIRLARGKPVREKIPEVLQPLNAGVLDKLHYEILPLADQSSITQADVDEMERRLLDRGYIFNDPGTDNLGRLPDGRVVVTDANAVRKMPPSAPYPTAPKPTSESDVGPAVKIRAKRRAGRPKRPLDIIEALAYEGGIQDEGGEVSGILGRRGGVLVPGAGNIIRASGRSLDRAREHMTDLGYLQPSNLPEDQGRTTVRQLLDAIASTDRARRGKSNQGRVFSQGGRAQAALEKQQEQDATDQAVDANARALDNAIAEMNLPPLSEAVRKRALDYAMGGMNMQSALEAAIMREGESDDPANTTPTGGEQEAGGEVAPPSDQAAGPEPGPPPGAEEAGPRPGDTGESTAKASPSADGEQPAGPADVEDIPFAGTVAPPPGYSEGKFHDYTAVARPLIESGHTARAWVLDMQRRYGAEFVAILDSTGEAAIAATSYQRDQTQTHMPVPLLESPSDSLTHHHSHPNGSSLSRPDLALLGRPIFSAIWAHGPDHSFGARLTDAARAAFAKREVGLANDLAAQRANVQSLDRFLDIVTRPALQLVKDRIRVGVETQDHAETNYFTAMAIGLHRAGILHYVTNQDTGAVLKDPTYDFVAGDVYRRARAAFNERFGSVPKEQEFTHGATAADRSARVRGLEGVGNLHQEPAAGPAPGRPANPERPALRQEGLGLGPQGGEQQSLPGTEPEAASKVAARQRQEDKRTAEQIGKGKALPKTPQESAQDLPLFGGERQTKLFARVGKHEEVLPEQVAEKFGEQRAAIIDEMRQVIERIGPKGIDARVVMGGLTHGDKRTIGSFDAATNVMEVALEGPNPVRTLRHEVLHALRQGGFFTDVEWSALQARALNEWMAKYDIRRRYADLNNEQQLEEAIADAFSDYRRGGRTDPPGIRRVWDRIVAFLKGVAGILDKHGITEKVFAAIEAGTVRDRTARVKDLAQGLRLSIKEARSRLQQAPKKDLSQELTEEQLQALGRMGGKIGEPPQPGLGKRLLAELDNRLADRFKQAAIDRVHGIAMNEKAANDGRLREGAQSATKLAHLKAAIGDIVHAALTIGAPKWDQGTISYDSSVMPPMQILERAGDRAMEFQKLLAAGSAQDRDKINRDRIRKKAAERGWDAAKLAEEMQNYEDNGRLFKDDEIAAANKLMEVYPDFRDLREKWNEYNKKLLDFYEQSGMIDENSRRLFETLHRNYVPFNRVMEDPKQHSGPPARMGFQGQHPNFWRQKGSLKNVKDLYQNAEANIARGIEAAINTVVMLRAEQDNAANGFRFFKPVSAGVAKTLVSNRTMLADLKRQGLEITADDMEEAGVDMDAIRTLWSLGAKPKGEIISWLRNGKVRYATDVDPLFYRAATQINASQNATLRRILAPGRAAKHLLTAAVGLDPSYQLANWLRDAIHIWQVSDNGKLPFGVSIRGTVARLMGDPQFQEFLSSGGGMSAMFETAGGLGRIGHLRSRARALTGQDERGPLTRIIRTAEDAVGMLQHFESTFEYGSRFGIYKKLVKEGKSRAEAAWQARDAATDFARRGDSPLLNAFIDVLPFFNAGIQGLYRTYTGAGSPGGLVTKGGRAARGRGGLQDSFAAAGKFAMKGMILSALSLAMFMRWKDDDRYKELTDYQKDMYWHWWIGDTHYKFPKPFETGTLFGTIPERTVQLAIDHNGSKFAERLLWNVQNQFRLDPTPQIIRPIVGVAYNWDQFRNREVVPSWLEQGRLPAEQYDATTPLSAIAMGRTIGYSPKKVEYLIDGYLGALGSYIMSAVDFGMRTLGDYPPAPTPRWTDFPLVSRVIGEGIPSSTQYTDNFYAMRDDIERTYGSIQAVIGTGEAEYATKLMLENAPKLALRGAVNDLNRQLQRINQTLRAVKMLKGEGGAFSAQKRSLLDQLTLARNNITKASANLYDFYQKAQ